MIITICYLIQAQSDRRTGSTTAVTSGRASATQGFVLERPAVGSTLGELVVVGTRSMDDN